MWRGQVVSEHISSFQNGDLSIIYLTFFLMMVIRIHTFNEHFLCTKDILHDFYISSQPLSGRIHYNYFCRQKLEMKD